MSSLEIFNLSIHKYAVKNTTVQYWYDLTGLNRESTYYSSSDHDHCIAIEMPQNNLLN